LPFSYIEESTRVDERLLMSDASGQFEKIEVRQELVSFEKSLKEFGIPWKTWCYPLRNIRIQGFIDKNRKNNC